MFYKHLLKFNTAAGMRAFVEGYIIVVGSTSDTLDVCRTSNSIDF
jgi:hypothetical protein